jgi:ABC-2 type transport system ATP-binding protein
VSRRPLALLAVLALAGGLTAVTVGAPAQAAAPVTVTKKSLLITTKVGPTGGQTCVVDADLYTPSTASAARPAPAILTTNGFGGSKADQAGWGMAYAKKGYVVLSYSGLGFGSDPTTGRRGSDCKITLDDRAHDGRAGSQLIDFLAGLKAANDGTRINYVRKDKGRSHDGTVRRGDIRVGMVGLSYGGQVQFAVAGVDPRLDTIVPLITWNDLAYALAPNNTSLRPGTASYTTPGTEKFGWTSLFFSLGFVDGARGGVTTQDPSRLAPCPNFADQACVAKAQMDALGYPDATTVAFARNASAASYLKDIRIPTLLGQGQADTLFNLQEATATYRALKAGGVPVKMMWQQWGHSNDALPGEFDLAKPDTNYQGQVVTRWFDHYLKGSGPAPSLDFEYFRDWVKYTGNAAPAFGKAPSFPLPATSTLYLSAPGDLVRTARAAKTGASPQFATPGAGVPTSYTETSALDQTQPVRDTPGTFTAFSTPPLTHDVDVVGIPKVTLRLSSATAALSQTSGNPAGQLVAFVKLYDVAPDGTIALPHRLISPIRVTDVTKPVVVELPGIVHRFAKGHRLQLVVALSDFAYKGNTVPQSVSVTTSASAPSALVLPATLR